MTSIVKSFCSMALLMASLQANADCTNLTANGPISTNDSANELGNLDATKAYFAKIIGYIKRVRDFSAQNTGELAQHNSTVARLMDHIPTLAVDNELVDFGVRVSQALRGNTVTLQLINIALGQAKVVYDAGVPQVGVSAGYYGGYYGGIYYSRPGFYYDQSNAPYKYDAVASAQGYYYFRALIAQIDEAEGMIRRRMTDKFQVQF